ncbi:MAG TPA: RagB/SusD family nutrient uptake outer membrane protein [Prolixibacteraceae bacterium]|nr:RagB/SusD family nutrient uptake outer membrane protein [Prolixibacteraceae bacterium]
MKNRIKPIYLIAIALFLGSCSLDRDPISDFSELTVGGSDSTGGTVKFKTRAEMKTQYDNMYNELSTNRVESWILDYLIYSDTHSDNAYRGATDLELTQLEQQRQDGNNLNINRDWDSYFGIVAATNSVINNIDSVPDPALTAGERKQWKAEALVLRSMIYFDLVRLWGDVPLILVEPPAITSDNIEEVYPFYYPARDSVEAVYAQIIMDLNTALETGGAPAIDNNNKFRFSRTVANALLAKIYAEPPVRDYAKVIQYCTEVEKDVSLVTNYGDLFEMNTDNTDVRNRNTSESIFEITFSEGGNWITWMSGIDLSSATSVYDWAKWFTPSRNLIAAFDEAGDTERKRQTIVFADVIWSNHYPSKGYPFMYKYRSKFHSVIKIRLADILLLKAEAYVDQGNTAEATALVNRIRTRAKLPSLITVTADDVLNERRLELAFEGHRWFDLVRTGKVFDVMNALNSRDVGRLPMNEVTVEKILLPIPQPQIDKNPSMLQNPGY